MLYLVTLFLAVQLWNEEHPVDDRVQAYVYIDEAHRVASGSLGTLSAMAGSQGISLNFLTQTSTGLGGKHFDLWTEMQTNTRAIIHLGIDPALADVYVRYAGRHIEILHSRSRGRSVSRSPRDGLLGGTVTTTLTETEVEQYVDMLKYQYLHLANQEGYCCLYAPQAEGCPIILGDMPRPYEGIYHLIKEANWRRARPPSPGAPATPTPTAAPPTPGTVGRSKAADRAAALRKKMEGR
jgi:hypothetical protein